jgi:hypothetical protein
VELPGLTETITLPFGAAHLICREARSTGVPGDTLIVLPIGLTRDWITVFEQFIALLAFNRLPVTVLAMELLVSPPLKIRFLIARQSLLGS